MQREEASETHWSYSTRQSLTVAPHYASPYNNRAQVREGRREEKRREREREREREGEVCLVLRVYVL